MRSVFYTFGDDIYIQKRAAGLRFWIYTHDGRRGGIGQPKYPGVCGCQDVKLYGRVFGQCKRVAYGRSVLVAGLSCADETDAEELCSGQIRCSNNRPAQNQKGAKSRRMTR